MPLIFTLEDNLITVYDIYYWQNAVTQYPLMLYTNPLPWAAAVSVCFYFYLFSSMP